MSVNARYSVTSASLLRNLFYRFLFAGIIYVWELVHRHEASVEDCEHFHCLVGALDLASALQRPSSLAATHRSLCKLSPSPFSILSSIYESWWANWWICAASDVCDCVVRMLRTRCTGLWHDGVSGLPWRSWPIAKGKTLGPLLFLCALELAGLSFIEVIAGHIGSKGVLQGAWCRLGVGLGVDSMRPLCT